MEKRLVMRTNRISSVLIGLAALTLVAFPKAALHLNLGPTISGLQESSESHEKTGVVEFGEVKPPKLLKAVTPQYPLQARRLGFEGTVIVEATTDIDGRVKKTKVLKSVPYLDQPAVKAIRQWVYEPALINGHPRPIVFTVTVNFSLHYGEMDKVLSDIEPPKLMTRVTPVYPPEAKKAGIEGTVILGATIDGEGKVTDLRVLESVPGLDQAAVDALKQWVYYPVWLNNQPVIYTFTVAAKFSLKPGRS
jgi:TonB family protein